MSSVGEHLVDQAAQQHPAAYDPNSNGATEANCKRVGGLLRTLKFDFEDRFQRSPSVDHPIFAWLVEQASWIVTTREKLTDGRTPCQLARGSKFNRECLPFGEVVFYKLNAGQLRRAQGGKLGQRWARGVFLGYVRDSYEYAVRGSAGEVVEPARSFRRVPESERHSYARSLAHYASGVCRSEHQLQVFPMPQ